MSEELAGKVAVVTGAGRGVGRAYANALAAEGAAVVVNDLGGQDDGSGATVDAAQSVVDEIVAAGGRATASNDSVADFDGAGRIVTRAIDEFGRLDILVNNAGIIRPTGLLDAGPGDWADVLAVHANGTFNCIRQAAPMMVEQGGGSIVTTGDITTDLYFPRLAAYRSAKAAIAVLTLHAARELAPHGINVNSVMPGATATRMSDRFFGSLAGDAPDFLDEVRKRTSNLPELAAPAPTDSVPPLGVFLCTAAGRSFTGYQFQMHGTSVGAISDRTETRWIAPVGDAWSMAELAERIPGWLAETPVEASQ